MDLPRTDVLTAGISPRRLTKSIRFALSNEGVANRDFGRAAANLADEDWVFDHNDPGTHTTEALEQAQTAFNEAGHTQQKAQQEAWLARQTRSRRYRLSLRSGLAVTALTAILSGGLTGLYVDAAIQRHTQGQIAAAKAASHSERYIGNLQQNGELEEQMVGLVCLISGLPVGLATASALSSRLAHQRAKRTVQAHAARFNR